jgi:hypothetical protein
MTTAQAALQEPPHSPLAKLLTPTRFLLRHPDGRPWSGATLRLIAWPHSGYPWVGEAHRVQAVSDERGELRVDLFGGMLYRAQASQEIAKDELLYSKQRSAIHPGRSTTLIASGVGRRTSIRFADLERLGPCRLFVEGEFGLHPGRELELLPDRPTALPLWPQGRLELRDARGRPIYAKSFFLTQEMEGRNAQQAGTLAPALVVQLVQRSWLPVRVKLTVWDPQGRAVPQYQVRSRMQSRNAVIARGDAEGAAEFVQLMSLEQRRSESGRDFARVVPSFSIEHPEHPVVMPRLSQELQMPKDEGDLPELRVEFRYPRSHVRRLRLLRRSGEAWTGLKLLAHVTDFVPRASTGDDGLRSRWSLLETDAEGFAKLHLRYPYLPVRLIALPTRTELAELASLASKPAGASLAPLLWLSDGFLPELAEFRADQLQRLQIDVRRRDGSGLRFAEVEVHAAPRASGFYPIQKGPPHRLQRYPGPSPRFVTGRSGRLFLLHSGIHGSPSIATYSRHFRKSTAGPLEPGESRLRIQIEAEDRLVRGRVLDPEGKAAAFAELRLHWRGNVAGQLGARSMPENLGSYLRADAAGRFEFFAPRDSTLQVNVRECILNIQGKPRRSFRGKLIVAPEHRNEPLRFDIVLDRMSRK